MNKLLKIGMAGGLVFGIVKLLKMKRVSDKMVSKLLNRKVGVAGLFHDPELGVF